MQIVRPHDTRRQPLQRRNDASHLKPDELTTMFSQAFTIHPSDTLQPGMFRDGAPSRPPSRASARGVSSGLISTTGKSVLIIFRQYNEGLSNIANESLAIESEEEQMNRAMAMSMSASQTPPPGQETGTIGYNDKPFYGPANRDYYDPSRWAMTSYTGTQEILLNPEAQDRTRPKGTPAFIKPSPSGHRLPALLKILHAIPMAREALLNRNHTLSDYGRDKDWWDGAAIKILRIVNLDSEGRQVNSDDVLYETQRLMAFLDETDRAYGSADVLADLDGIKNFNDTKVYKFLEEWHKAADRSNADLTLAHMFASEGIKTDTEDPESSQNAPFYALDVIVESEISHKGLTLYEALDNLLWRYLSDSQEAYLKSIGDVVIIEVHNENTSGAGLGIEIPSTWYPDRYLASSIQRAKDMRVRKAAISADLQAKEASQSWMTNGYKPSFLATTAEYFERTAASKRKARDQGEMVSEQEDQDLSACENTAKELKILIEKISQKLQAFEEVREGAREQLREISQLYTKPSADPKEPPLHKYTLRGVSIGSVTDNPHKLYVLERTEPEEADDILSTKAKDWQWWKFDFISGATKPVVHAKVTEDEVLKAVSTEAGTALLVYASERAISYESGDLPPQLHNFVRVDNLSFSAELEASNQVAPATPNKRKANGAEDWDMETQYHRSPPYDRDYDFANDIANDLDPNPPGYYEYEEEPSAPPALPSRRSTARTPVSKSGSYDDTIPTSLRATGRASDPTSMIVDFDDQSDQGQEMQERGGGKSLLQSKNPYKLGSYNPGMEIDLEDDDEK